MTDGDGWLDRWAEGQRWWDQEGLLQTEPCSQPCLGVGEAWLTTRARVTPSWATALLGQSSKHVDSQLD